MDVCRVCLCYETDMIPLDESFVENYNTLTNLNVKMYDELPQYTCKNCLHNVKKFMEFREKSISSETTLRKIIIDLKTESQLSNETIQPLELRDNVSIGLKEEIKHEEYDDDLINDSFEERIDDNIIDSKEDIFLEIENIKTNKVNNTKNIKTKKKRKLINNNSRAFCKLSKKIKEEASIELFCGLCKATFGDTAELNEHLEKHIKDKHCSICNEVARSWSHLLSHRLMHVPKKQKRCHLCNKRYATSSYLEFHYVTVHFGESFNMRCSFCSLSYDTPRKLRKHIWALHSTKKYICDYCSKCFYARTNLRSHIAAHMKRKSYVCDWCGLSFNYMSGLKDHTVRKHVPSKVYCKICNRAFATKQDHDRHKCTDKQGLCPTCGKHYSSAQMKRHLLTHTRTATYKCDRCPASYKSRGGLKVHLDRHDGNKTQQCEYCPAKFYNCSTLIKHRRTHTGEKPYVCKVCSKGFTGNHNLKVHMKVHGEYLVNKKEKITDMEGILKGS